MNKNPEEIKKEIARLKEELSVLENKPKKSPYSKTIEELAELIHNFTCQAGEEPFCDWFYDDGSWNTVARMKFGNMAKNLSERFNPRTCIKIFRLLSELKT